MNNLKFHNKKFEAVVSDEFPNHNGPITETDALDLFCLDCEDFLFDPADYETLSKFKNIDHLDICIATNDLSFLSHFPYMEHLRLEFHGKTLDFSTFPNLEYLEELELFGGTFSSLSFENLDILSKFPRLHHLTFHDFGFLDLAPLTKIPQLSSLYCGYSSNVINLHKLEEIPHLDCLTLIDISAPDLSFLEGLNRDIYLTLSGVSLENDPDWKILDQFPRCNAQDLLFRNFPVPNFPDTYVY